MMIDSPWIKDTFCSVLMIEYKCGDEICMSPCRD